MAAYKTIEEGEEIAGVVTPVAAPARNTLKWGVAAAVVMGIATVGYVSTTGKSSVMSLGEVSATSSKDGWMQRDDVQEMMKLKVVYGDLDQDSVRGLFTKFQSDFNRDYASVSETEEDERFLMFKKNLVTIDALNRQNPLALFGITEAADYTEEERNMKKMSPKYSDYDTMLSTLPEKLVQAAAKGPEHVAGKSFDSVDGTIIGGDHLSTGQVDWADEDQCAACAMFPHFSNYTSENRPENFDWRALGAVTPVKNQKYCGSCWTFSTAADIEGTHFLATGENISLSEQQIVACDTKMDGCEGGYMYAAMQYVSAIGGLVSDEAYPYEGIMMDYSDTTPTCKTELISTTLKNDRNDKMAHIEGYQFVAMGEEFEDMMATVLLKNGPLSVALNANGMEYYVHGITGCESIAGSEYCEAGSISTSTPCDPTSLDHGVLAVAYGVQEGTDYWVIKNSWGTEWGEGGYYRVERGTDHCGVANMVVHSVYKSM